MTYFFLVKEPLLQSVPCLPSHNRLMGSENPCHDGDLQIEALGKLPEGEIAVKVKGNPPANEATMRTEAPRGELFYYAKGNDTRSLERLKIRTPTFANLPSILVLLPGCQLADVPVNVLSIDPCVSCTER